MKHLILLDCGHAHLHVLSTLAAHPLPGVQVTLVTPYPRQLCGAMMPGFIAGHYTLDDCVMPLEPLLKNTGIRWLARSVTALDTDTRSLTLDDGSMLAYDWLSINTGAVHDRQKMEAQIPGAREHGLFVRPLEPFAALWPRVVELAHKRTLRVAVIGAGATGIELAMAMAHRLPGSSLTLISGDTPVAAYYPLAVQQRVRQALKQRHITVLNERVVGLQPGEVLLANGARLVCDVPVIALGGQAPAWLADSGLALDEYGLIAVDACQRSTRHAEVFAVGDISRRVNQPLAHSGVYTVRAARALLKNLTAVVAGAEPRAQLPPQNTLNLLSCGNHEAIASWGNYSAQGRWVGWLKDWLDRRFVQRYRKA